jgi:Predicted oxidoreductases (related to aryl-alcohol dehydrogenases)
MNPVRLGRSDVLVSPICLGTMTFGEQVSEREAFAIMDRALERGVNFWDTAEMYAVPARAETYGATETIIGRWLAAAPVRVHRWCWPARWPAPRVACPGFARQGHDGGRHHRVVRRQLAPLANRGD